jgi:hypothetical protein
MMMAPVSSNPPSFDLIDEASRFSPAIFTSNPVNSEFRVTPKNSLVLNDVQGLGAIYIQSHLSQIFPLSGWNWMVRALPDNKFLVEPSSDEWKKKGSLKWANLVRRSVFSNRNVSAFQI